jgi:hypothetical protein
MSYRNEKTESGTEIVFSGWEKGIAQSPHEGVANMQGVNINTESGEAMCNYNRTQQFQTGTSGSLTQVNTNTVSISGITLKVGQVITITGAGTTGLSGDYYYLSTGKLYAGALPPNTLDSATAVTGISAGTATFSIKYPLGKPIMKATEIYHRDSTNTLYYRYYFLDDLGNVWCHDTYTLVNWDTPVWFFVGNAGVGASGLAVLNGWLTVSNGVTHTYWKLTILLGNAWQDTAIGQGSLYPINFSSSSFHNMLFGQQGKLYGTDGNFVTSLFPTTSLLSGVANIQSYSKYTPVSSVGSELVTNGGFTGSATGWTLQTGWAYNTDKVQCTAASGLLLQNTISIVAGRWYTLVYDVSGYSAGTVRAKLSLAGFLDVNFTVRSADGTYTEAFQATGTGTATIEFIPASSPNYNITNVSIKEVGYSAIDVIIGGSIPQSGTTRIPAVFFTDGTLPSDVSANTVYWIQYLDSTRVYIFTTITGSTQVDPVTGAVGNQYFNTFSPVATSSTASRLLFTWSPQRLNLPFYETATSMVEIGNTVLVGGKRNIIYPWNQVSTLPGDLIFLPENNTVNMISVNNTGYIFCGTKGNIYITNGSSVSRALAVPDYTAGIAGTPSSYIEPYFSWGDATYARGRVFFSVQDQTATKTGNCGGIWSFTPIQNFSGSGGNSLALRLDNQNSYGTYNGLATLLIPSFDQSALGTQYWSGWMSSISNSTYGMDFSDTIPEETTIIETDLIKTGTAIDQKTFSQIEYKLATPLADGETIEINYRQNGTDAWASVSSVQVESTTNLSGIFIVNFQKGQWLQLQAVLNPLASTSSSFCRLTELRIR